MKILYAIQGTGNGHLSRARDIIPLLQKKGDLDILVSGTQADVQLPYSVDYQLKGLGFIFGKTGGIDLTETFKSVKFRKLWEEVRQFPIKQYDLIINDFEPISAWASLWHQKPCVALSHQSALLSDKVPKPDHRDIFSDFVLRKYAPAQRNYGFHFKDFDRDIYTPIIRQQIREADTSHKGHYTVYLPAFADQKLVKRFKKITDVSWEIFSKHTKIAYEDHNIKVLPIDNQKFIHSMASSEGVICGAGFETPAEALYLQKKLLVIPMKNQHEQHYNAQALKELGVKTLKNLKKKQIPIIEDWIQNAQPIPVDFPDMTQDIIDKVFEDDHKMYEYASEFEF